VGTGVVVDQATSWLQQRDPARRGRHRGDPAPARLRSVETCVTQTHLGNAIQRRRRNQTTECARRAETDIIGHDQQKIRRAFGRHGESWPIWLRLRGIGVDLAPERLRRIRQVAAFRECTPLSPSQSNSSLRLRSPLCVHPCQRISYCPYASLLPPGGQRSKLTLKAAPFHNA
jgi:hypothetical protein